MNRKLEEHQVLKKLGIPDFRHITKEKVIDFASMLPEMAPEVAKKALEQFPEFAKTILEITKDYKNILETCMMDNSTSTKAYYDACNIIIESLTKRLEKDDLSFEEQKDITDKMLEISKMISAKDTENKGFNWNVISIVSIATVFIVGGITAVLGGKVNINLPKKI